MEISPTQWKVSVGNGGEALQRSRLEAEGLCEAEAFEMR